MSAIAIITARGGSKRIPKKNIRDFCGKPIIAYSIQAALASNLFETVMVSTDSEEIAGIARNYGAERAEGEFLAFQDSDDIWHAEKLEKQYRYLCSEGADLCFCGMNRVSEMGSRFYYPVHPFHPARGLEEFLAENRAGTQTMLMRRRVWEELRFDEGIRRYQDWDFGIRAAEAFTLCYLPEALVESEVSGDSISAKVKSYPHLLHLYRKHEALYLRYPDSMAVMNRRLGKRVHPTDPALAAAHFKKSFGLSRSFYDFGYWIADSLRAKVTKKRK